MDPKIYEAVEKFMAERNPKNIDEANEMLQEFVKLYNDNELNYEESPAVQAYELVERANDAKSKKERVKLAKKALEIYPDCLEAKLILVFENDSHIIIFKELATIIEEEKNRLKKEGFFSKNNIGDFYVIFETRPYITTLHTLACLYASAGMINKAIEVSKEILRLNKSDNTGTRYLLMGLYAYKEEINNMNKLFNVYKEECLFMLFPYLVYYFKQGNMAKALSYLDRIKKVNKNFVKYFKDDMDIEPNMPDIYSPGDMSEVEAVMEELEFLFLSTPGITELILNESKYI